MIHGDMLVELPKLDADSIDAVCTDPPYHLTSIVKRFGATNAAPAAGGVYGRSSAGFMGQSWDGGDEVMEAFAAFGEKTSGTVSEHHERRTVGGNGNTLGKMRGVIGPCRQGDEGSAARFFYCAKADEADRAGSKHPTVKPLSLMDGLVKLITPPGGTVLDPFSGSGTTLLAADRLQFDAIGIEQSATYVEDIKRRMQSDAPLFAELSQ